MQLSEIRGHWHQLSERFRPWRPYFHICHLHRPVDLLLFLLPTLWFLLAISGPVALWPVAALLAMLIFARSAGWVYNDLQDARLLSDAPESFVARGLVSKRDAWWLTIGLLACSGLLALILGVPTVLSGVIGVVLLSAFPYLKRRTLFTQPYMGLCFAWGVVVTATVVTGLDVKAVGLLFTAALLWATCFTLLYAIPRRQIDERLGVGSLLFLLSDQTPAVLMLLQALTVVALWFLGDQLKLSNAFFLMLLLTLAQIPWQQWLMASHAGSGAVRAYRSNLLFGLTVLVGFWSGG